MSGKDRIYFLFKQTYFDIFNAYRITMLNKIIKNQYFHAIVMPVAHNAIFWR